MNSNQGCLLLVGLVVGLPILMALWPLVVVVGVLGLVVWVVQIYSQQVTALELKNWNSRHGQAICRWKNQHGVIQELVGSQQILELKVSLLDQDSGRAVLVDEQIKLAPAPGAGLFSASDITTRLERTGIELIGELSVEAKAMRTALQCVEEMLWSSRALEDLQQMGRDAEHTITIAPGNELLEPAIPQLLEAKANVEREIELIQNAVRESSAMLNDLGEFLSVPASIRPVLNFDPTTRHRPKRLQELQASFEEVVLLNQVYRDLSENKLI